ncbi:MAG: hypothetical protein Q8L84_04820 [Hyphomonas sp.]|nr:hypothetical protein [Hyphomonas sp.]
MFSLAMLGVVLFLGLSVSGAARENLYGTYLRHYDAPTRGRRIVAQSARTASWLFSALFYLCIALGICGLIYAGILFGVYVIELLRA